MSARTNRTNRVGDMVFVERSAWADRASQPDDTLDTATSCMVRKINSAGMVFVVPEPQEETEETPSPLWVTVDRIFT